MIDSLLLSGLLITSVYVLSVGICNLLKFKLVFVFDEAEETKFLIELHDNFIELLLHPYVFFILVELHFHAVRAVLIEVHARLEIKKVLNLRLQVHVLVQDLVVVFQLLKGLKLNQMNLV